MAHVAKLFSTIAHFWSLGITKTRFAEDFFKSKWPHLVYSCIPAILSAHICSKITRMGKKFACKTRPCLKEKKSQIRAHALDGAFILSFLE